MRYADRPIRLAGTVEIELKFCGHFWGELELGFIQPMLTRFGPKLVRFRPNMYDVHQIWRQFRKLVGRLRPHLCNLDTGYFVRIRPHTSPGFDQRCSIAADFGPEILAIFGHHWSCSTRLGPMCLPKLGQRFGKQCWRDRGRIWPNLSGGRIFGQRVGPSFHTFVRSRPMSANLWPGFDQNWVFPFGAGPNWAKIRCI